MVMFKKFRCNIKPILFIKSFYNIRPFMLALSFNFPIYFVVLDICFPLNRLIDNKYLVAIYKNKISKRYK